MRIVLFALVVLSPVLHAFPLKLLPTPPAVSVAPTYADEAVVVEQDDVVYRYAADGTGTKLETSVLRVQSAAALQNLAVLSFPYATGTQRVEIVYARVRKPDGSVVETPPADAQDQPAQVTQLAPMYSDLHVKQIPVRSLAVGDKLEFQLRLTQQQPEVAGEFWGQENFGTGVIYLQRSIELRVPRQKQVTVWSPEHPPEISEAGEEKVYRWKGSQLRSPAASNDDAPDIADATKPPIAWTTFASWEAVGLWYRGVIAGRDAVTPAIKAKADELVAGSKTDTEKVRALYDYVSAHNHYIGIDFGIGRYQPHFAAEVMTNQYGDCKDKHTLLAALLRAEGFDVSAVLIGAGIEMNEKVPMPAAFNHLITLVQLGRDKAGGEMVWLDATTEVAPYRALLAQLRDKQALVVPSTGNPSLMKTPALLPYPSLTHYEVKADLDKAGSFKGHVTLSMRGDDEIYMRFAARQAARAQWDQLSQNYSNGAGLGGTTSATVLDAADDTSGPWRLRFDYAKSPFGEWATYKIWSMLPNLDLPAVDEKKPPKKDIELGSPHTVLADSTIHLPEGYGVELPDAIHLKTAFATYDKTYQWKDGNLVCAYKLETLLTKVPAAGWKDYKKFVDDIGVEPWIQLTARDRAAGEKGPPLAGENNPAAAELLNQARSAIVEAKDKELARQKLEQAAAINEKQRMLWSFKGYLDTLDNNYDVAVSDYERELKQHPDETFLYPDLISAQGKLGQKDAQRLSLLAYAKADPAKDSVAYFVGGALLANGNVADAVEVYRTSAKTLPENKMIQVGLANVLVRAGHADEAVTIAKAAIDGSSDPNLLNDGAYVLVNDKAELPLAESSARRAVDLLETESAQITLESVNTRSFRRVNLLLASWDTLGWIYFAEGKTDLAEQYVRAAWNNSMRRDMGLHLGEILEKRGDPAKAMQLYEVALGTFEDSSTDPMAVDARGRIARLARTGVPQQHPRAQAVLQEQRMFHLPRPGALKGSAIVYVQASAAKTEKVNFVSGDEAMRGLTDALTHLDLGLAVPRDSHALLLRSGVLFCGTQSTCEFVLTPPATANVQ